jgi:hypothetical protein
MKYSDKDIKIIDSQGRTFQEQDKDFCIYKIIVVVSFFIGIIIFIKG